MNCFAIISLLIASLGRHESGGSLGVAASATFTHWPAFGRRSLPLFRLHSQAPTPPLPRCLSFLQSVPSAGSALPGLSIASSPPLLLSSPVQLLWWSFIRASKCTSELSRVLLVRLAASDRRVMLFVVTWKPVPPSPLILEEDATESAAQRSAGKVDEKWQTRRFVALFLKQFVGRARRRWNRRVRTMVCCEAETQTGFSRGHNAAATSADCFRFDTRAS